MIVGIELSKYQYRFMKLKTVVIFGVFDDVHEGHRDFIRQAKKQGDKLVAIVARDETVKRLKNKIPIYDENKRLSMISEVENIDLAFLGDREQGVYHVLKGINPGVIFLGYDQMDLYNDIIWKIDIGFLPPIELIFGKSYKPHLFHSSILKKIK